MKSRIVLYADEFDYDVWEQYCEICDVDRSATSITIDFDAKDVKASYEDDEEDYDEEDGDYPCDNGECPFNAEGGYDCRNYCGLGVDEDEEEYIPSAENGDYGPSNPWDAPGMSIHDFI